MQQLFRRYWFLSCIFILLRFKWFPLQDCWFITSKLISNFRFWNFCEIWPLLLELHHVTEATTTAAESEHHDHHALLSECNGDELQRERRGGGKMISRRRRRQTATACARIRRRWRRRTRKYGEDMMHQGLRYQRLKWEEEAF